MKAIRILLLCALLFPVTMKGRTRVNEYDFFETYCQYAPTAFVLCSGAFGIESRHGFADRALNMATSFLYQTAVVYPLKWCIRENRPTGSDDNSFPSGHTAATFSGAELIRMEYGWAWGGVFYANAVLVGAMRVAHHRLWWWDVAAGAAIGIASAHVGRITTDALMLRISPASLTLTYNF